MRTYKWIFPLLALIIFSCQNKSPNTVIKGKVTGGNIDSISYSLPINGTSFSGFTEIVYVDSLGNFTIDFNLDKPSFVTIVNPGIEFLGKVIIEPDQEYDIVIDGENNKLQFTGISEKAQNIYSTYPNPSFIEMEADKYEDVTSITELKKQIGELKEADIRSFQDLLEHKEISKPYYELVKADRDCYYAALEAMAILLRIDTEKDYKEQITELDKIFKEYPPTVESLMTSDFWFQYASEYISYKMISDEEYSRDKMRELYEKGQTHTYTLQLAKANLTGKSLEYFQAGYIYFQVIQKRYEEELIDLFNQFKTDYPNSKYTQYIEPYINTIVDYYKIVKQPFKETVVFVPDYQNINSLQQLIELYKGKKLYIDVWATWCGPCKAEFANNKALKKYLKREGIEPVYISIDRDENEKQWKDMIKFYDLEGNHLRVNKSMDSDLRRLFDQNGMLSIPWYISIDENGNIINLHEKRPSSIVKDMD